MATLLCLVDGFEANTPDVGLWLQLCKLPLALFTFGFTTQLAGRLLEGQTPDRTESLKATVARAPLLCATVIYGLVGVAMGLLLVVPGILAGFHFALSVQAVMLEGVSGNGALIRSKKLIRGNLWMAFGVIVGVTWPCLLLLSFGHTVINADALLPTLAIDVGANWLAQVGPICWTVLYYSLRQQAEESNETESCIGFTRV